MLIVDICYLFVDVSQLHVALVHLVVVDDLVDLVDPLIVHEHAVVTLSDHLLPTYELVVLRFHPETHRLNTGTLVQKGIRYAKRLNDLFKARRVVRNHFLDVS